MYRFFEKEENLLEKKIKLDKENSHHLLNVLRLEKSEKFEVLIGGIVYIVIFDGVEDGHLFARIINSYDDKNESNIKIRLFQGLPKSDKLELIIQKVVELGVYEIIPFESERTIVKWDKKKIQKKIDRYQEIAKSAAKQAKRGIIPLVKKPYTFKQMLDEIKGSYSILAYENGGQALSKTLSDFKTDKIINIIIGPEGGFSEGEVMQIKDKGARIVHLGNRIMRTETCAIALSALVQYEIGDLDNEV